MFVVVKYFNYRKDVSFDVINVYDSKEIAIDKACDLAIKEYGEDNIVEEVKKVYVYVPCIAEFTADNGYGKNVFAVMKLSQ